MTSDASLTSEAASERRLDRIVSLYIACTMLIAVLVISIVAVVEYQSGHDDVNWVLFALISALLIVTETQSRTWIRVGDAGVVTPSWTFAFALLLIGSPFGAIAVVAFSTIAAELIDKKPFRKMLFNTAQIAFALGMGALTLFAFGIHGAALDAGRTPASVGLAVILSGLIVFATNGVVLCKLLAILEETTFMGMMRRGFALSMSADGAMIAIAPILVITAQNSLLMLPMIGLSTLFVYQTARRAIEQTHQADHDPLTQLANRRSFSAQIDSFTQSGAETDRTGGVFILDLDKFKEINDRLGHATGDLVLQSFAQRLLQSLPDDSTVARLGGDEFAVLIKDQTADEVRAIAERLLIDTNERLLVDGFPISAGSSIGVSFYPEHGSTPTELMHAADVAMYRAKRFRSRVEYYEARDSTQEIGRVALLGDLAEAVDHGQFVLAYQPQIDIRSGRTTCVEALLRWNHPRLGMIPPGEFVALAEQTDLIAPLTEFVIDRALSDAARLPDDVGIAINVSARNLQDRHFADSVLAMITEHRFDRRRVELEITESAIALDPEHTRTVIEQLRAEGVRISIDDFGTGYSSFSTLREFTADVIKIDRSFVTHSMKSLRDQEIVRGMIEFVHGLGLTVVAEGVETAEVLDFLADAGCDIAQGYLIARPALIEDVVIDSMALGDRNRQIPA